MKIQLTNKQETCSFCFSKCAKFDLATKGYSAVICEQCFDEFKALEKPAPVLSYYTLAVKLAGITIIHCHTQRPFESAEQAVEYYKNNITIDYAFK